MAGHGLYSTSTGATRLPRIHTDAAAGMHLHASGGSGDGHFTYATAWLGAREFVVALAEGRPFITPDTGETWGNATGRAAAEAARVAITAEEPGPIVLGGTSMGGFSALRYAQDHTPDIACIVLAVPVISLQANRDSNPSLRTLIDAAWGVTYPAALPADAVLDTDRLRAIPMQLWYATDDIVSDGIIAFAAATGAELRSVGALGHTDAAIDAIDTGVVADFIQEHTEGV